MLEQWRAVPGYEGAYEVSDLGRVRSLDRDEFRVSSLGKSFVMRRKGRVLSLSKMSCGHLLASLPRDVKGSRLVHVLVLTAFRGPRPEGREGRHLNGNPGDNRLINLEWSTHGDNLRDKKWHKGSTLYRLSGEDAVEIKRLIRAGCSNKNIANKYGVTHSNISAIRRGKSHKDVPL